MGIGLIFPKQPLAQSELGQWIAEHRPELAAELGPLHRSQCLAILNRETGLNISGNEEISKTLPIFLAAPGGPIPCTRIGKRIIFDMPDILEFKQSCRSIATNNTFDTVR